jgi:hypothetical protein
MTGVGSFQKLAALALAITAGPFVLFPAAPFAPGMDGRYNRDIPFSRASLSNGCQTGDNGPGPGTRKAAEAIMPRKQKR